MKRLIAFLILLVGFVTFSPPDQQVKAAPNQGIYFVADLPVTYIAPAVFAQEESGVVVADVVENTEVTADTDYNFFIENWAELLLAIMVFLKVVVNLTPTKRDNEIFGLIDTLINAIVPNYKKGGGTIVSNK